MTEKESIKKLKKKLGCNGLLWFPPKVKFYKQVDIFGVFDCVFYNGIDVFFIQLTTKSNRSYRFKKIMKTFRDAGMTPPRHSYVYWWDEKAKDFRTMSIKDWLSWNGKQSRLC